MGRYTPAARVWVALVFLGGLAASIRALSATSATTVDGLVLVLLAVCAAISHLFPIRSADGKATFAITNILLVAGAVALPPGAVALLPLLALTPQSWIRRHAKGEWVRWAFNTAQATLATLAGAELVTWAQGRSPHDPRSLAIAVGAGVLFVLAQAFLVAVVISCNNRIPLNRAPTFARPALLGELTKAILGVAVAGLWLAEPMLLLVLPVLLVLSHQLTRTAHLAHMAEVDPKTGLHNARHFEDALEDELAHSRRLGRPLAVLFCDLDHFKRINDSFGHDVGDQVLRAVAGLLQEGRRNGELVARFGGEEFVVLLPGTDADEAIHLAERVRLSVAERVFDLSGNEVRCTISIGVATCPEDGADVASLVRAADQAMYRAKETRNAVARAEAIAVRLRGATDGVTAPVTYATNTRMRVLLTLTAALGLTAVGWSLASLITSGSWSPLPILITLALLAELFPVRIYEARKQSMVFSLGTAVALAAVSIEPVAAVLVGLAAGLGHALVAPRRGLAKLAFGLANPPVAAGIAAIAFATLRPQHVALDTATLVAALVAVVAYVVANTGLVVLMMALRLGRAWSSLSRDILWLVPTNVLLGLTGAFIGVVQPQLGLFGIGILVLPVLLMRWTLGFYARRSRLSMRLLEHRANYDALTDLANRYLLEEQIHAGLTSPEQGSVAVLLLDLDRFQEINDTFGHESGDLVLRQVGPRMRAVIRPTDTLGRLGGDEFAVVLPATEQAQAEQIAHAILRAMSEPFSVEGYTLEVGAKVGLALGPAHGGEAATLLQHADVALGLAKRGRDQYAIYNPDQDHHSPERLALIAELRQAINEDSLTLHYQPQLSLSDGCIRSVEALVRWNHPRLGMLPPDAFISLAEHTGLIGPLTQWVLGAALRQCRAWLDRGHSLCVSVNISAHDLHDRGFPELVARLLETCGVPAERLCLELTEGAMLSDFDRGIDVLTQLHALGVNLSVDDFGTGYASLAYLKRLPITELKIDRGFVSELCSDAADRAIVETTVALGHKLGLAVVAEGVEDAATLTLLERFGCDVAQGYLLSKPLPTQALDGFLNERQHSARAA